MILDICSKELNKDFTKLIKSLNDLNFGKTQWYFCTIASRNPFTSPLFDRLCKLLLLTKLSKEYSQIIVKDSDFRFCRFVNKHLNQCYVNESVSIFIINQLKNFLIYVKKFFKYILYITTVYLLSRFYKKKQNICKNTTLIDTYIHSGKITDETCMILFDKYLPNIVPILQSNGLNPLYIPTIIPTKNLFFDYIRLRKVRLNCQIKESYLTIIDFIYILFNTFSRVKIKKNIFFYKFNISELIRYEYVDNLFDISSIIAKINYRFHKSLSVKKINFKNLIVWFENQVLNKGHCFGVRTFYPNKKIVGYTSSFICDNYHMYQVPTLYEYESDLSPTHVVLSTYGYEHLFREVYKDSIVFGPALRFEHLKSEHSSYFESKNYTVCFLCEIDTSKSIDTLSRLIRVIDNIELDESINLIIKYHPTCMKKFVFDPHNKINFYYAEHNLYEVFVSSNIVIGSGTLSITESLLFNNYTILLSNNSGVTQIPVPEELKLYINNVYSDAELQESISLNLNYNKKNRISYDDVFVCNSKINNFLKIIQ